VLGLEPLLLELLDVVVVLHASAHAQVLEAGKTQGVLGEEAMGAGPQVPTYVRGNVDFDLYMLGRDFHPY
jgi:hypothetical protein